MDTETKNSSYTILVVDDDELTRSMYAERLQMEPEFSVITAVDGLDALEKAQNQHVDLVFTGIVMPRLDGFGLIRRLQEDARLSEIPVMISSHLGRRSDFEMANSLGVKRFMVRGETTPNQVVGIIRSELLQRRDSYQLRIAPDSPDYVSFVQTFFGLECRDCQSSQQLPVVFTVERAGTRPTFVVNLDCDRCREK